MLIIQKYICLLDEFHFNEFASVLLERKAELPLKLISIVRQHAWQQPDSEELCRLVYGNAEEKARRKFLQLTHHTFKLGSFLSRNYPSHLVHNLSLIERLVNSGENAKANCIADYLCDIAEKIEDFSTRIAVLKFLAQQAFITDSKDPLRYHQKINELLLLQVKQNEVYSYMRENLHYKKKENLALPRLNVQLDFFNEYIQSPHYSISIPARFGKYYELAFLNHNDFYNESTFRELEQIERDINNNAFLVFPFLDDVLFKVMGLKLQWLIHRVDTEGILKESLRIIEEGNRTQFWKSYLNLPELFAISIQCSHFLSHYSDTFREDFYENLPEEIKSRVNFLKEKLRGELKKPIWNEGYIIKLINTRSFYSGLLLLGTKEEIQESVNMVEETLISYQQISFQKFLDGMFAGLITGYFSLKNYTRVAESYKRYRKATAGNSVNEENDLTICVYYYASQWLLTGRKQYLDKFEHILETSQARPNLQHVTKLVLSIAEYFSFPLQTAVC
jgi:hypothetical protein